MDISGAEFLTVLSAPRPRFQFSLVHALLVVTALGLAGALALEGQKRSREKAARALVEQLGALIQMYGADWAVYPPGDGSGSAGLLGRLRSADHKCYGYYMPTPPPFQDATCIRRGRTHLSNPAWPGAAWPRGVIHYRWPGMRNPDAFDLWAADASGRPDGINNWKR